MGQSRLAVVIPAYCEEQTVASIVAAASKHGDVIVVDDHSIDATTARAMQAGAIVVRNAGNLGYDRTLEAGFAAAADRGYSHVVTLDADGEHDPALVALFRSALLDRSIPLVLGFRPRKQRLAEIVMGWLVRWRFGVQDILCGMKGYDLALWQANDGFDHQDSIGTELAIQALRGGAPFIEIAVTGRPRIDAPRFDRRLRANLRIFRALYSVLWAHRRRTPLSWPAPNAPDGEGLSR